MAILTADRIRERMAAIPLQRRFIATPLLDPESQLRGSSIDIRLGFTFRAAKRARHSESDLYSRQNTIDLETHYVPIGERFVLHPRHFVLGQTLEYLCFPDDLAGYVVGRSSWGRQGLVIATAVGVHPGFRGVLTLEITNLGEIPLVLYPLSPIAQLFVHTVEGYEDSVGYTSMFSGDTMPETRKPDVDWVMERVLKLARANTSQGLPTTGA